MVSAIERVTELLDEMGQIEELAKSFQSGEPMFAQPAEPDLQSKLQEMYLDWYTRSLNSLSEQEQEQFSRHYSGSGYNIRSYIADPAGTGKSSHSTRSRQRAELYYWKNDFERCFRAPFGEQRLILIQVRSAAIASQNSPAPPPPPAIDTIRLHPRIKSVSKSLFKNGHYREAIFRACLALNEAVQQRSGRSNLDGNALMLQVFSANNPVLQFSGHPDEQKGYMWLFAGVMMAVRNPRAHHLGESEDLDANEALEILAMISALHRALDCAELVEAET